MDGLIQWNTTKLLLYRNAIDGFYARKDFGRDDDTIAVVHILEKEHPKVEIVEQRRTGVSLRMLRRYGLEYSKR